MGFARCLCIIGCAEKVPSASAGTGLRLGLGELRYRFKVNQDEFHKFFNQCNSLDREWNTAREQIAKLRDFHDSVGFLFSELRSRIPSFSVPARGYSADSFAREVILAELASGATLSVDWRKLTVRDVGNLVPDVCDNWGSVADSVTAAKLSHLCFKRRDWALLGSCFACYWQALNLSEAGLADVSTFRAIMRHPLFCIRAS